MRRRDFISFLGGAAVAWPLPLSAQQSQKPRRIAFVHSGLPVNQLTESGGTLFVRMFYVELRKLGFAEGTNLVVERFSGGGRIDRYAALAADVVGSMPEVIVANQNNLVKALMVATATIPIVGLTTEPVEAGLVLSLARPGANLTGVSVNAGPGIISKRLQILKEVVPSATKIVYLTDVGAQERRTGDGLIGKILTEVTEAQIRAAFTEMVEQKIEAAIVAGTGTLYAQHALIIELAAKHHLPVMYPYREYVELGGLITYAPDLGELAKRMAADVQQILNGARVGDIPFYLPIKYQTVLNLKTAKALGLTIPFATLAKADEVIE
jgi:putative tryptophan/tyrosine transport system substrate-binding protein